MSATIRRWFEVFLIYPVIGAILAFRGSEVLWRIAPGYFGSSSAFRVLLGTLFVTIVALRATWWGVRWFRPNVTHFANIDKFPPALLSVFVGYIGFALIYAWEQNARGVEWLTLGAPLCVFVIMTICALNKRPGKPSKVVSVPTETARPLSEWSTDELQQWLKRLNPIKTPRDDLMSSTAKTTRLVAVITESPDAKASDERRSAAVRGPFGVGKSSLILMVEESVRQAHGEKYIFVHTSCWGFESSIKAQERVLEACVEELSQRIDCNMLRRVPAHYGDALQKTDSWINPLLVFAFGETNPIAQLERFVVPLRALNVYLVVVIEDADRNGAGFDTGQILAMLHHFRGVPRLTFIVSASKDSPIELFKVADEVIFVDPLPWETALSVTDKIRALALSKKGFIDPEGLRSEGRFRRPQSLLGDADTSHLSVAMGIFSPNPPNWARDLGSLLGAMRVLKGTLSDFQMKWEHLMGEVDPDDLLVACALRHAAPRIYDFIQRHLLELQSIPKLETTGNSGEERKTLVEKLKKRWATACENADFHVDAAAGLATKLFPALDEIAEVAGVGGGGVQSVYRNATRYFNRIHLGVRNSSDISDKKLFRLLADLQANAAEATDRTSEAIISDPGIAVELVDTNRSLDALNLEQKLPVVSRLLSEYRRRSGKEASIHNLQVMMEWLPNSGGSTPDTLAWLQSEVETSLPENLLLASQLIAYSSDHPGLGGQVSPMVLQALTNRLSALSGEAFAAKFSPSDYEPCDKLLCSNAFGNFRCHLGR